MGTTNTFILTDEAERMLTEHACRKLFNDVHFEEVMQQNNADRSYVCFSCSGISQRLADLTDREIEVFLENYAIRTAEEVLWGHKLEAYALCSRNQYGGYDVKLCLIAGGGKR